MDAAQLHHPNIVQAYEVLEDEGHLSLVMEYVEGQPLHRVRRRLTTDSPSGDGGVELERLQIHAVLATLQALEYAHDLSSLSGEPLGLVHRDISPQNVMLTYRGEVWLLDFGIAKANDSTSETATGIIKGKIAYMAPEQASGRHVDRRADLFAVGILLWEAFARRRMWDALPDVAILGRLGHGEVPSLAAVRSNLPAALVAVCGRALALAPSDRYATAQDFRDQLEHAMVANDYPRATEREVASVLLRTFGDEYEKLKATIRAQLQYANAAATGVPSTRAVDAHRRRAAAGSGLESAVDADLARCHRVRVRPESRHRLPRRAAGARRGGSVGRGGIRVVAHYPAASNWSEGSSRTFCGRVVTCGCCVGRPFHTLGACLGAAAHRSQHCPRDVCSEPATRSAKTTAHAGRTGLGGAEPTDRRGRGAGAHEATQHAAWSGIGGEVAPRCVAAASREAAFRVIKNSEELVRTPTVDRRLAARGLLGRATVTT